jgi:hypothetical protein
LHTTILSLLAGNRKIIQFQIEAATNKVTEILRDIGLSGLAVRSVDEMKLATIREFVEGNFLLDDAEVNGALAAARLRVENGLDAFEQWLLTLR